MTYTEDDLRAALRLLEHEAPDEDVASPPALSPPTELMTRRRIRQRPWLLAASVAVVLIAVASVLTVVATGSSNDSVADTRRPISHSTTRPLTPIPGALSVQVVLDRTFAIVGGPPIPGHVVVTNLTGKPVIVPGGTCDGWIGVVLTNAATRNDSTGYDLVECQGKRFRVGTSRYPLSVLTRFTLCTHGPAGQLPPRCLKSNTPPLPVGTYRLAVDTSQFPIHVHVLRTPSVRVLPRPTYETSLIDGPPPAHGALTLQVRLNRTVARAGGPDIHGYVTIDNTTGAPVTIANACTGWYQIALGDARVEPSYLGLPTVGCRSRQLPVGRERLAVSVRTSYNMCGFPPSSAVPRCTGTLRHQRDPALPAGTYDVRVRTFHASVRPTIVSTQTVRLTPAR